MASGQTTTDRGAALADLLLGLLITACVAGITLPFVTTAMQAAEARNAAAYLASRLRETRLGAVASNRHTALVFDQDARGWTIRQCVDGNGNGVRRAELDATTDRCRPPQRLTDLLGVELGLDPAIPGIDEPAGRTDGVRFGRSAMASCSPLGHCSPGTLYLRSDDVQFAVRVAPITGRTRIFRFDPGSRKWDPS